MAVRIACTLTLETGDVWEVVADQRDMSTAEQVLGRKGLAATENPVTFARCLSWAAARRVGKTTDPWTDFDRVLVEADTSEPETVDPTLPATSGG